MSNKITIYRGDTCTVPVTITNDDGELFDLEGYRMRLSIKTNKYDANYIVDKKYATITTPMSGQGIFDFDETETDIPEGRYWYDVEIYLIAGGDIKTVLRDEFVVEEDITKENISV